MKLVTANPLARNSASSDGPRMPSETHKAAGGHADDAASTRVPNKADWGKAVCSVLVHCNAASREAVTPERDQQEKKMRA